jgi:hypothetical protein
MRRGRLLWITFLALLSTRMPAQEDQGRTTSLGEAVEHAVQQSKLGVAGGAPFHLKAHIAASGRARPEYTANVEEYWVAPDKWRRTVESAGFSQTLVINGDKTSEKLTGDYYPFWLHDLVTAIFDPLPMAEQLKQMRAQLEIPEDSAKSNSCLNMQSRVGIAPAQNNVAFVFCFTGQKGLLQAVLTPAYQAQFASYQSFQNKFVARTITAEFTPGLAIAAKITELSELTRVDESLFAVESPTPAAELMKTSQVGEDSARVLALKTPAIAWPAVREGKTTGLISVYMSNDRAGHVREVWPVVSDNPELERSVREQLLHWQYKPYSNGGPSQMEAVLTFAFSTRIENPVPVLSNAVARKQAARMVEALIPPSKSQRGATFTLRASVDESGKVQSVQNPGNVAPALYSAGSAALKQWRFRPYINKGKPDRFYADVTFQVR